MSDASEFWRAATGAIAHTFATDLVWRIEGHSVASKKCTSRDDLIHGILAPSGSLLGLRAASADQDPLDPR